MSPGYAIITGMPCGFETVDYSGVPLICFHERWEEHILKGHPDMVGQQAAVITALSDPYYVTQPGGRPNRRVYYRPRVLRYPNTNDFLLVVADYPTRRQEYGGIVTAYSRRNLKKSELLIWTRPGMEK